MHSRRGRLCIAVEEETLLIVNIGHKSELDSDVTVYYIIEIENVVPVKTSGNGKALPKRYLAQYKICGIGSDD